MIPITSGENSTRSIHSITLPITQREEMYPEDENIGLQAELNISTTRKG